MTNSLLLKPQPPAQRLLLWGYVTLLAVVPFHALLTTWLSSNVGYSEPVRAWKELVILALVAPAVFVLARRPKVARAVFGRRVNQLLLAYLALHLVLIPFTDAPARAVLVALSLNLRFLAVFVLAQLLALLVPPSKLRALALKVALGGLFVVALFGLLQATVLPDDFLRHFGYGPDTIKPFDTIDQNPEYVRILSTLRGPNPLGIYLAAMLPLGWLAWRKPRWRQWLLVTAGLASLYASYSRSAWLGLAMAGTMVVAVSLARAGKGKLVLTAGLVGLVLLAGGIFAFKDSAYFQNVVLHDDRSVAVDTSDNFRADSYAKAARDIAEAPLGHGPGTAGPATFRDDTPRLTENYYLQLGLELGVLGLGLFLVINLLVAASLWAQRADLVALGLLAGLVAVSVSNLFLHGWTDETVALTWWGLAGLLYR